MKKTNLVLVGVVILMTLATIAITTGTTTMNAQRYAATTTSANMQTDHARNIADNWVKKSESYLNGGYDLNLVRTTVDKTNPPTELFYYTFRTKGTGSNTAKPTQTYCSYCMSQGYRDKDVITTTGASAIVKMHTYTVGVQDDKVTSAVLDRKNMMTETPYGSTIMSGPLSIFMKVTYDGKSQGPWDAEFSEDLNNKWRFTTTPSEATIISSYYLNERNTPLYDITVRDGSIMATIRTRDYEQLKTDGWMAA
jgi:hypothetical protein